VGETYSLKSKEKTQILNINLRNKNQYFLNQPNPSNKSEPEDKEEEEDDEKEGKDIEELCNNSQFCQMLFLDDYFVVEFIRECYDIYVISFGGYICHQIFRDLMLLENQLPFFVLNKLHHMTKQDDDLPLAILAINSFTFFIDDNSLFSS